MGRKDLRLLIPTLALCFGSGMTLWLCQYTRMEIPRALAATSGFVSIAVLCALAVMYPLMFRVQLRKTIEVHIGEKDAAVLKRMVQPSNLATGIIALVMMLVGSANALGHWYVRFPPEVMREFESPSTIIAAGTVVSIKGADHTCYAEVLLQQVVRQDILERDSFGQISLQAENAIPGRPVASAQLDCSLEPGQKIRFQARPRPPYRSGTVADMAVKAIDVTGEGSLLARVRLAFLRATEEVLESFPLHAQGLIPGAALGEESMLDARSQMEMKTSGLTHLIAVSGGHVALVLTLCLALVGRKRGGLSALMSTAVLAGLCVLVGLEASVIRALTMAIPIVIAIAARLPSYSSICLAISALLCFLFAPFTATSLGFMLSWIASAGIIFFAPRLSEVLSYFITPTLASVIVVSLVASTSTLPLQLLMNPQASLWQVVANCLAAPAVAPLTICGLLGVILSVWLPTLAGIAFVPASWCTWWIAAVSRNLSEAGASHLSTLIVWVVYLALCGVLFVAGMRLDRRYHPSTRAR